MQKVQDVKLTTELIIVVLIDEIHAYKFADLSFLKKWQYAVSPFFFVDFKKDPETNTSLLVFLDTESPWQKPEPAPEQTEEDQMIQS